MTITLRREFRSLFEISIAIVSTSGKSRTIFFFFFFFLQGRFYLKNRQKPTATLIYTDNIIYNIYTTYIPPPPIINTFSDVKIHVSKVHVHQNSKR